MAANGRGALPFNIAAFLREVLTKPPAGGIIISLQPKKCPSAHGGTEQGEKIMQKVNFSLKGIRAEEMRFALTNVRVTKDTRFDLKPAFSRQVRRVVDNEKVFLVALAVKIENTEESPKPFDLTVRITGIFETAASTDEERKAFTVEATEVLYPYLRAAVTNLTTAAFAAPIVLPVVNGAIFPEDRDDPSSEYAN